VAVTATTIIGPGQFPIAGIVWWAVNDDNTDADPATLLKAAPGAGKALYITAIAMSGRTADVAITLQDEDGTVLIGPLQMQGDGGSLFTKDFPNPIKLIDNKALYVFATNTVDFTVFVEGFTGQAPTV
jgi:hypothetical protein